MIALVPVLAALAAFGLYFFYKRWRDQLLLNKPFPADWLAIVESRLPIYSALSQEEQSQLRRRIKFFIDRKEFYGCAGLTITDEIRVTIAAEACLLLLNKKRPIYPKLTAILVYPTAFRVEREQHQADGTVASDSQGVLGESWDNGRVILSWDDVEKGQGILPTATMSFCMNLLTSWMQNPDRPTVHPLCDVIAIQPGLEFSPIILKILMPEVLPASKQ